MDQQFIEGEPVFDAAGDKIGAIHEYNAQEGYIVVQKGWLFPKDLYIPVDTVQRNDAEGIYLSLHKDDLDQHAYDEPPAAGSYTRAATRGAAKTATAATAPVGAQTAQTVKASPAVSRVETGDEIRVPVIEEDLVVRKRAEELGRVRIHKEVLTEQQTVSAPVTHEEVYVQRVSVQGQYAGVGSDAFIEKDIEITVMGEQLLTTKRTTVAEEIRLHKDVEEEQQQITDTVRKERVVVDGVEGLQATDAATTGKRSGYGRTSNS
jgi:uncharacterized protein (TIGR02271 family)